MQFVFLALSGRENSRPVNSFIHHLLVCFEFRVCSLHCLVKEHQTSVIDSYNTLWCVLNALCALAMAGKETVDLALPGKEKHQTSVIHSYITLWFVFNGVCVPCTDKQRNCRLV